MEQLKLPTIPKFLNGTLVAVESKCWNALVDYINMQTAYINSQTEIINSLSRQVAINTEGVHTLANTLKEHLSDEETYTN